MHRSIPPVHELTSYNIGYKPKSSVIRYQRSAPAPTNMTFLPSAQVRLVSCQTHKTSYLHFQFVKHIKQKTSYLHSQFALFSNSLTKLFGNS